MKKVKFTRYLKHAELTDDIQRIPDEIVQCSDAIALILVDTGHAEYVTESKRRKPKSVKISEERIEMMKN